MKLLTGAASLTSTPCSAPHRIHNPTTLGKSL